MAEHIQPTADDELTPENKRKYLRGNFFTSWLLRRSSEEAKAKSTEEDEDEDDLSAKSEHEKKWRPERVRRKLRKIFRRLVDLDIITTPPTLALEEADSNTSTEVPDTYTINEELPEQVENPDIDIEYEYEPLSTKTQEDEGLLLVSEQAKQRYVRELVEQQTVADEALTAKEQTPIAAAEVWANQSLPKVSSGESKPSSSTASTGEILRRRQEKRLKKEVQKIKKEAKSVKREQQELKDQQREFSRQLSEQAKLNQERHEARRISAEKQPVHNTYEMPSIVKAEASRSIESVPSKEFIFESVHLAQPDKLKEFVTAESRTKPEYILERVEKAAEQNIPIEGLYERRHEVKDEEDFNLHARGAGSAQSIKQAMRLAEIQRKFKQQMRNLNRAHVNMIHKAASQPGTDLYTQAAKYGFWTALGLCIVAFFALWLT